MSWKYVFNANYCGATSLCEAAGRARQAGYQFFTYEGRVYFRDDVTLKFYATRISVNDLF